MEKKYYDLIVSLIKNHRKFAGCEAILDDIAEDVYNHAKVVLDTIDNEDVITSYLSKVVSTSIITVPKRLNINTRVAHRVIMPELKEPRQVVKNEIEINVPAPQRTETPELSFDNISDDTLQDDLTATDELKLTEELSLDEPIHETQEEQENEIIETFAEEPLELKNPVSDNNPDNFESKQNEDFTNENNLEENVFENVEELPEPDLEENDEINNLLEEDNSELESIDDDDVKNDDVIADSYITDSESAMSEEEEEEEEEEEDSTPEIENSVAVTNDVNKELVDKMINSSMTSEEANAEDNSNLEEFEETNSDSLPVVDELSESDNPTLDELTEEPLPETSEDEMLLEEDVTDVAPLEEIEKPANEEIREDYHENSDSFTPPNYKCFDYEPDIEPTYDVDEINECLIELDTKHPEWHVIEICELKYKDNKTVEEIAEVLGLDVESVVDTLSEVICAIKD